MFSEHKCYVEPFCGAAALLFMKKESKCEVLNDINGELTNLYRVLQHHLEEFVKQFKWALVSRKIFEWEQMRNPESLTDIQRAAHLRLARVQVEHLNWEKCITKYDRPHTLFFIDPPYYQTEGYGVDFNIDQYDIMNKLMHSIKGKAIITVNDHPAMRKAFDGLQMKPLDITYTVGGGKSNKKAKELMIWNW